MADTVTYSYRAQTQAGQPLSGTLDALDVQAARDQLQTLGLRLFEIAPVPEASRPRPLRGDDFLAFNQQLAHLTAAGLPVEKGLRLIAGDMASGRLARSIQQVANDLEAGMTLDQAFGRHAPQFPPLYGELIAAGVKTSSLPGMLFNLGRHLELVARVRAGVWRACAYPLMVMVALLGILVFISVVIMPRFVETIQDFHAKLPLSTQLLIWVGPFVPYIILTFLGVCILVPVTWRILCKMGEDRKIIDSFLLPLPLLGPILKRNMIARWCDGLRLGVEAGLDLPQAMQLAAGAIASPALEADTKELVLSLQSGHGLEGHRSGRVLPAAVAAAIQFGTDQHDLPATLDGLTKLYQQQAEQRAAMLPVIITPAMIIMTALIMGFVITSLFMPLVALIKSVSGGS